MQVKKDSTRLQILEKAKLEFINKGFKNASMRSIAGKANVSLSNIYNYFINKDAIFCEILQPLIDELDRMIVAHNSPENLNLDYFRSQSYQKEIINIYVNLIRKYNQEFKLLLFQSHGSSIENYREEYTNRHTNVGLEYLSMMKEKFPEININISEFFLHTLSSWWITAIGELVSHNPDEEELQQFVEEYIAFSTAGWKQIMNVHV